MLSLTDVKKHYSGFDLNATLSVRPGYVTGLIGANGAGKTTIFKAILGLIHIDSGEIKLFSKNVNAITPRIKEDLGVVLSDSSFSQFLKVKDIVPILDNMYTKFDKNQFLNDITKQQLPIEQPIKGFSTGMKAKLKLLIAMSHQAKFLILDEPTAGLDVLARDELLNLLREYMAEDENRSIIISSHISSDLENLCDDIYMIKQGRMIMHEDADVLLSDYAVLKLSDEQFKTLDKQYIVNYCTENYGYSCLTNQRRYFVENYPDIVIEKSTFDDITMLMMKGESQ